MTWRSTTNGVDWKDGGKIELKLKDGTIVKAYLEIDAAFDGEDEYPVPMPVIEDGKPYSFFDAEEWRKV